MAGSITTSSDIVATLFREAQSQGLSESTIAKMVGVHLNSVANWRRGKTTPSIIDVQIMAEQLGYRVSVQKKES